MSVKYCPHCGASLDDPSATFCPNCGSTISVAEPTMTKEPPPPPAISPPPSAPAEYVVYGGFFERLLAIIIDGIIVWIITAVISALFFPIGWLFGIPWGAPFWEWGFPWGIINWLIAFLYFWALEAYNNGQTVGKMALKLRTVDEISHAIAPPGNYVINNLSRGAGWLIVDFIIGVLANILSGDQKKRYRILQNLSKTVVIKAT